MPGASSSNVPGLTVEEADGSPSGFARKLVVPNGSLALSAGTATLSTSASIMLINRGGPINGAETGGMSVTAGATNFASVETVAGSTLNTTETNRSRYLPFAGTITRFAVRYEANPHTTDDTWTLRVNAADQGTSLTVPAGQTGLFTSAAQTVAVAAGDLVALKVVGGATSNATVSIVAVEMELT